MKRLSFAHGSDPAMGAQRNMPSGTFSRGSLVEPHPHSEEYRSAVDRITSKMGCTDIRDLFRLLPEIFDSVVKVEMEIDNHGSEPLRIGAVVDSERVYFTPTSNVNDPLERTVVPMVLKETHLTRRIGVMSVLSFHPLALNPENDNDRFETEKALGIFSSLVARTIDAKLDGLTALPLRKYFDRTLEEQVSHFRSEGRNFSLILVDLDHFKRVNDEFGHPKGDAVLSAAAMILHNGIRGRSECPDRVFRTGGEEFAVLLPDVPREEAAKIAERLRLAMKEHDFGLQRPMTCSVGLADASEVAGSADIGNALYHLADERLYQAKKGGRDSVISMKAVGAAQ